MGAEMSIEAMKLALDCLEDIFGKDKIDVGAINALRQAIEEAEEQEPVVFRNRQTGEYCTGGFLLRHMGQWMPLYTTPPQRKPLTDEQIGAILEDPSIAEKHQGNWLVLPYAYARAIEAAHGIKGEA